MAVVILGFAHGANDAGNIAGPLSVILSGQGLSAQIGVVPVLVCCGFRSRAKLSPGQFLVPSDPLVQPSWRPPLIFVRRLGACSAHLWRVRRFPRGAKRDGRLISPER